MISRKSDILVGLGILAGSAFLLYDTNNIPEPRFEPMGSAFLPRIVLGAMAVLAVIEIFRALFNHFRPTSETYEVLEKEEEAEFPEENEPKFRHAWWIRTGITLLALMGYTLLLTYELVNYYLLTFIFSAGLTAYLGRGNLKYTTIGIIVVAVILGLLYLLSHTMAVVLPAT